MPPKTNPQPKDKQQVLPFKASKPAAEANAEDPASIP